MFRTATKKLFLAAIASAIVFGMLVSPTPQIQAADHADAPCVGELNRTADIADIYAFLDPNDNNQVVLILTVNGFIVPSEAINQGLFDPGLRYRIGIENTGDAAPDAFIDVRFSAKRTASTQAQTATITLPGNRTFTAPTTVPNLSGTAPTPVVTTDSASGVQFFAGLTDDPFFFDIPGFARFVSSVTSGAPDPTRLQRGRDSFAGYNITTIALRAPATLFGTRDEIGFVSFTQRQAKSILKNGEYVGKGDFITVDFQGNPAVNVALIPYAKKCSYNFATPQNIAAGAFAPDVVATLKALGTNDANINALAGVAVTRGDYLRLKKSIKNSGTGGGNNPEAAFPNGRRIQDDVIDIILTIVANGTKLGDSVNANDVSFRDTFPFVAATQQPREGTADDNTRN